MNNSSNITPDHNTLATDPQEEAAIATERCTGIPWDQIFYNTKTGISQLQATLPPSQLSPDDVKVVVDAYASRTSPKLRKHTEPLGAIVAEFTGSSSLLEIQGAYGRD